MIFRLCVHVVSPTFSLDAVVLLAVLMWQRVGARLRQHIMRGACDSILTLGVLGAHGAWRGQSLHLPAERALAGTHSLSYRAARHHWILLCAMCKRKHSGQ